MSFCKLEFCRSVAAQLNLPQPPASSPLPVVEVFCAGHNVSFLRSTECQRFRLAQLDTEAKYFELADEVVLVAALSDWRTRMNLEHRHSRDGSPELEAVQLNNAPRSK